MEFVTAVAKKLRYWRDEVYKNPNFKLYDIDTMAEQICQMSSKYCISVFVILAQGKWESNWCLNAGTAKRSKDTMNIFNVGNTDDGSNQWMKSYYEGVENYCKFLRKNHYTADDPNEWFFPEDVRDRQLKNGKGYSYASAPGYWEKIYKTACDIRDDFRNWGVDV